MLCSIFEAHMLLQLVHTVITVINSRNITTEDLSFRWWDIRISFFPTYFIECQFQEFFKQQFTNLPPSQVKFSHIDQLDGDGENSVRMGLVRAVLHEVDGVVAHQHLAGDLVARQNKRTLFHVPDTIARTQLCNDNTWNKIFKIATLKYLSCDIYQLIKYLWDPVGLTL